jgi:hypothetical protein
MSVSEMTQHLKARRIMDKHYPTSSAQDQVLKALGLDCREYNYDTANDLFRAVGISVSFRRQGRVSVPVVTLMESAGGAFNAYGEGESWSVDPKAIDLTPLASWMSAADAAIVARRAAKAAQTPQPSNADVAAQIAADHVAAEQRERDERRARKDAEKAAREQRARTRNVLRVHGYRFKRFKDVNDDDETEVSYTLYAPDGRAVSVAQALAEIEAQKSHES